MTSVGLTTYFLFVCAINNLDCSAIPITYEPLPKNVRGMTLLFKDGRIMVGINRSLSDGSKNQIKATVTHEVAHILVIKDGKHRRSDPHGPAFKYYCGKLTRPQRLSTQKICNEESHGFI